MPGGVGEAPTGLFRNLGLVRLVLAILTFLPSPLPSFLFFSGLWGNLHPVRKTAPASDLGKITGQARTRVISGQYISPQID